MTAQFLPPRACEVLLEVSGEERWVRVEFVEVEGVPGWRFEDGAEVDAGVVVDWREVA